MSEEREPLRRDLLADRPDTEIEILRKQAAANGDDPLLEACVEQLVLRGLPVLTAVARKHGSRTGLGGEEVNRAIEDASARLLAKLGRPDRLPTIPVLAARIARECVEAQRTLRKPRRPRLTMHRPHLRIAHNNGSDPSQNRRRRL